ncbi:DUF4365 domain-containing protein [Schlesneria sp.]|uniref:DUF4365 domain-containing protein n=1 Tax=Schlesneria sp. TaxID=2762018 RepID=UPI002EE07848
MEEESFKIVRSLLPAEWVMHEYRPDYGIDFSIEPFESVDVDTAETLGEHLFVQLKSVKKLATRSIKVHPRYNVEKRPLSFASLHSAEKFKEITVIPFQIDTNDLVTVQTMGAAATVLLILVALDVKRVFFICLNDLIDKIIVPEDPVFAEKDSKLVFIPAWNELTDQPESLVPLKLFSKRAKFYTAIAKFAFQYHELSYAGVETVDDESPESAYANTVRHFLGIVQSLSIWDASEYWPLVAHYKARLNRLEALLDGREQTMIGLQAETEMLWQGLNALGRTFEEIAREWFLPTYLGQSLTRL